MDIDKKEEILKYILKKYKSGLNDSDKQILYNLDKNILYYKRDIDNTYKNSNDIFGYKIVNGENNVIYIKYKKENDSFVKVF